MWLLLSIFAAFWCKAEIPKFAERTNRLIYREFASLIKTECSEQRFLAGSLLQPQQSRWANLFFPLFPLLMQLADSPLIGLVLIILCFLSLLDICYYLTDIRYIALIFLLISGETLTNFHNETLLFTLLFCLGIAAFSYYVLQKEAFGSGDMLLLVALSPLLDLEKMLLLMLIACMLGILFFLIYQTVTRKKLIKLPFVPFIGLAMAAVYLS